MAEQERITGGGRKIWGLHPNVFFMGITSLLTDISSEMMFTLVPLFLTNVLGAPGTIVGLVGGLAEGADAIRGRLHAVAGEIGGQGWHNAHQDHGAGLGSQRVLW